MKDYMFSFSGKVVLITGAARGIGKAIANAFGKVGARIAISDSNSLVATKTLEEMLSNGMSAEYFPADLATKGTPARLVTDVAKHFGRLDVLINNARAGTRLSMSEETEDNWDLATCVGLRAAYFTSQAAIPIMRANSGGNIVNISSISARLVSPESGSYHAAKAGLDQITRYLAANGGPKNVRVNAIQPGFIVQEEHLPRFNSVGNKDFKARALRCHPLQRVGSSEDVANTAMFLCTDAASFITGQTIGVDGGFSLRDAWSLMRPTTNEEENRESST